MNSPVPAPQQKIFRSVDQLAGTAEFESFLDREFPVAASEFPEGISRRRWVQLMGASIAFAGASGCRYYREEFAGFVNPPENRVPGFPETFATNFEWAGRVVNVVCTSMDGRPIKLDGNAMHPLFASTSKSGYTDDKDAKFANAGSDVFTQAAVLSLYDPDRMGDVVERADRGKTVGDMVTVASTQRLVNWVNFDKFAVENLNKLTGSGGEGLAILFEPSTSPTTQRLLADVARKLPNAKLVAYQSIYNRNATKGIAAAGGGKASATYRLDKANIIVSIDADLFGSEANAVVNARQFAMNRSPNSGNMSRLYCIESQYSSTGSSADVRYALQSSQMAAFLQRLEAIIDGGEAAQAVAGEQPFNELDVSQRSDRLLQTLAADLLANKGKSVIVAGFYQSPQVHQLAMRINAKLENIGQSVNLIDIPNLLSDTATMKLDDFVAKATEGAFTNAWVFADNPVYSVAGDLDLTAALQAIADVVYAAQYDDETAALATWSVPLTHPLEMWSDVRSNDGTYGVCQPMIAPVTGGRSMIELLSILAGLDELNAEKVVRETAKQIVGGSFDDRIWQQTLHDGFLKDSQSSASTATIETSAAAMAIPADGVDSEPAATVKPGTMPPLMLSDSKNVDLSQLEILVLPSDTVYDGRLLNNGWLQECPQPITKLTWDNAALMSIATARALNVKQGEIVVVRQADAFAKVPVFIVPGQAEGTVVVNLGYGRTRAGSVGGQDGKFTTGHSLQNLRRWKQAFILTGVEVSGTSVPYKLATTQDHFALDDQLGMKEIPKRAKTIIREGTLKTYQETQTFAKSHEHPFEIDSLWKEPDVAQGHAWAMSIDLNKCINCNACVIACQAENNVPIVGKEQVSRGREMHWLRIDRYFVADMEATKESGDYTDPVDPRIVTQPMACAHCQTAPCEQVCPVAATVHTEEGLNAMAYNRCVGTRYCANNCPYKVRRFNYFNYNQKYGYFYGWQDKREETPTKLQSLVLNPEVTVRGRGVMEKCTYCVQRIQNGKIMSRNENGIEKIEDGDIQTACQQACPTQAIVFGDLNDTTSRVYANHNDPRSYAVLEELNIKPRTQYLARLRNVPERLMTHEQLHPEVKHGSSHGEHSDEQHSDEQHSDEQHSDSSHTEAHAGEHA